VEGKKNVFFSFSFLATRDNGVKENTMGAKVERGTVLFFQSDKGR
jgi:hypothetical protein